MLCLLCLWIAPGSIQSMLPHHLSAWQLYGVSIQFGGVLLYIQGPAV